MTELERKIQEAAKLYYTDGTSPYTDEEFDALVDELRLTQPNSELFRTGWGYSPQSDTTAGAKIRHKYARAGSLNKCHNLKELGWSASDEVDASLKLDGLSVILYYVNSMLTRAVTRGDGEVGIDITEKVRVICPPLQKVHISGFTGAVRGEILMAYDVFEKYKAKHPEAKNPRNTAAGLINAKELSAELNNLDIVVYFVVAYEGAAVNSVSEMRKLIAMLFDSEFVVVNSLLPSNALTSDGAFQGEMEFLRDKWYTRYPADGIVLTRVIRGSTGVCFADAKAFKFPAESKVTTVKAVEWNMSKTRYAVPRVEVEPVELSGTSVGFATGYHAEFIEKNNIGVGAKVTVRKSGEIIPQILDVVEYGELAQLPTTCPVCGSELKRNGVHLVCVNAACQNASFQDLLIWMQQLAPVDGLKDALILKFLNEMKSEKMLTDLTVEDVMLAVPRLTTSDTKSQFNLFATMWNKLHEPTSKFPLVSALRALNIPRIGEITSAKLAQFPDLVEASFYAGSNFGYDLVCALQAAIGEANTESWVSNHSKIRRLGIIHEFIDWSEPSASADKGKVAITGKLSVKRSDFEKELRSAGYTPGDISKDTKFLITDDPLSSSSKNKKADQWGIVKITEDQFRSKYM